MVKLQSLKNRATNAFQKAKDKNNMELHQGGGTTAFGELVAYLLVLGCFGMIAGLISFMGLETVAGDTILVVGIGATVLAILLGKRSQTYTWFELASGTVVILLFLVNYDTIQIPEFLESLRDYVYKTWKAFGIMAVAALVAIFED